MYLRDPDQACFIQQIQKEKKSLLVSIVMQLLAGNEFKEILGLLTNNISFSADEPLIAAVIPRPIFYLIHFINF